MAPRASRVGVFLHEEESGGRIPSHDFACQLGEAVVQVCGRGEGWAELGRDGDAGTGRFVGVLEGLSGDTLCQSDIARAWSLGKYEST